MELKLNDEVNEKEIVYYILSLMVFLSSFYISTNLLMVNAAASLIIFNVLTFASTIYIFNIEKYSLFKHDFAFFQGLFCVFSLIYLISAVKFINQEQYSKLVTWLIICGILIQCINYIILSYKQNELINNRSLNILIGLASYTYIIFIIILGFSWMYISNTKSSVNEYVIRNFKTLQTENNFILTNFFNSPKNYLFYEKQKLSNIFVENDFNSKKMKEYIKARFAPIDKTEDYILYSTGNCFGGINLGIGVEGAELKYKLIAQKFLFLLITLVTIVNLSSRWRE